MNRHIKLLILLLCMFCALSLCSLTVFATETGEVDNRYENARFYVIETEGAKTNYEAGELFDPTGFRGLVALSDGTSYVIESADLQYAQTAPLTESNTFITFTHNGLQYDLGITVAPASVIGIELTSTKTEFLALEKINASDFSVNILYSDGTSTPVDASLCTFYPAIGSPISAYTKSISVSYTLGDVNYTDSLDVTVSPILLVSIEGLENVVLYEATVPTKPEGLKITAYYDGHKTISQVITDYEFSYEHALVKANDNGNTTFKLILDSKTEEIEVKVLPIVSYSIAGFANKYYYGDAFSYKNAQVTAMYSDGTTADVTSQVTFDAPSVITAGSKVTLTHNGYDLKDFLPFTLPEGTLMVVTQPTKLQYDVGESFDSTGLSVGIAYADGERRMLSAGEYTLTASSPLTATDTFVAISYYGASTNISISVGNEVYIVSLNLIGAPDVMEYYEGYFLSTAGLNIEAYLSDGTKTIVNPMNLTFTPALNTPLTTDITSVKISANDGTSRYCEVSFPITVKDKYPTFLVPTSMPNKLVYAEGEVFNPDGLSLMLMFNDGTSIVPSTVSFSPELGSSIILHTNATEKCIIYAIYEYEGVQHTYPIEITVNPAEVDSLLITRQPAKTVYEIGEEFDPAGLEILLIYKDRALAYQVVPEGYYTFAPTVITETTTEIVFSFRGYTVSLPITVNGVETTDVVTDPVDPPVSSDTEPTPPETSDITTEDVTTEDVTTEEPEPTTDPGETSEPEVTTEEIITTSPEHTTTEGDSTTEDNSGGEQKEPSSLLYLWIIVIVIIIVALIALIIYYKKNFT